MGIPQNSAAIDTDFLNHVVSMKHSQSDISTLLINMFSALSIECIMHPLVYQNEIQSSKPEFLFTAKIIQVPSLSDIFEDETQSSIIVRFSFLSCISSSPVKSIQLISRTF